MNYTKREKTLKQHTIQKAIDNARLLLKGKSVCLNATRKYKEDELLTTEQLNNLVEQIVSDSIYY